MYTDIHTHLTHEKFQHDLDAVIQRARDAQLSAILVNGLEPDSNRQVLKLASQYDIILPALGIYPIDAINGIMKEPPYPLKTFDVDNEIEFIKQQAKEGTLSAIGECGLDAYWVGEDTFVEQERVFLKLLEIAMDADLPIIIHSRKREKRTIEILSHHKPKKVNFHCYSGKVKLAIRAAEDFAWHFSIPANARKNQGFTQLLLKLPKESILTETDAPFLGPETGTRNEPKNVVDTVKYLAELRQWHEEEAQKLIFDNFQRLVQVPL